MLILLKSLDLLIGLHQLHPHLIAVQNPVRYILLQPFDLLHQTDLAPIYGPDDVATKVHKTEFNHLHFICQAFMKEKMNYFSDLHYTKAGPTLGDLDPGKSSRP